MPRACSDMSTWYTAFEGSGLSVEFVGAQLLLQATENQGLRNGKDGLGRHHPELVACVFTGGCLSCLFGLTLVASYVMACGCHGRRGRNATRVRTII